MAMPQTKQERPLPLVVTRSAADEPSPAADMPAEERRGFGGGGGKSSRRKGGKKRSPALSKADWGPLGKHPDLEAIVARQRLHLPLSGRITEGAVTRAWKNAAAEHHPDRGGQHDTMQSVNGARDLLLGRGVG
ncbi:MAG: molecular chaperone DnaJ [Cyanobacteria bacterium]|nr:molecular chaperone DnaJ [Cyanobacteriota bacterium]